MSVNNSGARIDSAARPTTGRPVILLSSYGRGATEGKNLGLPGYSYDFVAKLFKPLLEQWSEVRSIEKPERELEAAAAQVVSEGGRPIHVCFRAFQDVPLSRLAANVVVPAWEFPDVPNHEFDGNPQNDWVATSRKCDLVIVGGPFTADAFRAAGIQTPIEIVPVPTPAEYFSTQNWHPRERQTISANVFEQKVRPEEPTNTPNQQLRVSRPRSSFRDKLRTAARRAYRYGVRPFLPQRMDDVLSASLRAAASAAFRRDSLPDPLTSLDLSGVVYTSIFNPADGRKNWEDLITAFLTALGDREDATLVLKLITPSTTWLTYLLGHLRRIDMPQRCRIVLLYDYLSNADMHTLCRASTYYVTSTRAEGNCLPVMNYLAAGRPVITPCHTAISDYFDNDIGWTVDSHPEPTSWPQDTRYRVRTTWHRIVWPSLVESFRSSYKLARTDPDLYTAMCERARARMAAWCSSDVVAKRLHEALDRAFQPAAHVQPRRVEHAI